MPASVSSRPLGVGDRTGLPQRGADGLLPRLAAVRGQQQAEVVLREPIQPILGEPSQRRAVSRSYIPDPATNACRPSTLSRTATSSVSMYRGLLIDARATALHVQALGSGSSFNLAEPQLASAEQRDLGAFLVGVRQEDRTVLEPADDGLRQLLKVRCRAEDRDLRNLLGRPWP